MIMEGIKFDWLLGNPNCYTNLLVAPISKSEILIFGGIKNSQFIILNTETIIDGETTRDKELGIKLG